MLALAGAVTLIATLAAQTSAVAASAPARPTGAAAVYKWGTQTWRDEYESGIHARYTWNSPQYIENRFGMLVLKGRHDGHAVGAKVDQTSYRYGRWETRIHLRQWVDQTQPFRMVAELVPTNADHTCGSHNIVLAAYTMGQSRVHMAIRNGQHKFTYSVRPNLGRQDWNTFAVEIARHHISWFVNDHVVMTEHRAAARSGLAYTLRYRWVGPQSQRPPWMQMDWSRFYSMKRPNQLPITAPSAHESTYQRAC